MPPTLIHVRNIRNIEKKFERRSSGTFFKKKKKPSNPPRSSGNYSRSGQRLLMRSAVPYDSGVFPPSANCRSRRCCNASPLSSTYVAYVSHVHFWHGREQRWRHVRGVFPYTWVEGGEPRHHSTTTGLSLSLFWKERERRRRPLGQISAWFTTIPGQGTFFIPHTLYVVRVTTAPCLELLSVQSATISHRPLPRDVISCCIVSELNNSRYFERGEEGDRRDSFFDPRLFEKEGFYGRRVIVDDYFRGWMK